MKKIILALISSLSLVGNVFSQDDPGPPPMAFRKVSGHVDSIKGPGWEEYYTLKHPDGGGKEIYAPKWYPFSGKVIEVQPGGLRIDGFCVLALADGVFFVTNYPYRVAEGDIVQGIGKDIGIYSYATVLGGSATLHQLDYGTTPDPVPPPAPLTPAQIEAAKQALAKKKIVLAAKALKSNQDDAARGDSYGELRMGERYRDGDGVPKDLALARSWLTKAAAHGEPAAKRDLAQIP